MSGTSQYVNRWAFEDGATPTFDSSSDSWDFLPGSSIDCDQEYINSQGLTGTAKQDVSRSRDGLIKVGGTLSSDAVSPAFLGQWLLRAMGGGTVTSPTLADAPYLWGALMDCGADVFNAKGCVVNRFGLNGRAGSAIECVQDVIGLTHGQDVTSFTGAALGTSLAYEPLVFSDLGITIAGSSRIITSFGFEILNGFVARPASGSLSADAILRTGLRVVTLQAMVPCTSTEVADLYGLSKDGSAASLVLTNGACSATLSFSRFQVPKRSPRTQEGEVLLPLRAQIRGTGLGAEMTATIDATP